MINDETKIKVYLFDTPECDKEKFLVERNPLFIADFLELQKFSINFQENETFIETENNSS